MPRTFFDLSLLANTVAKLANIVGEHVKFDMFANNVGQFGHTLRYVQNRGFRYILGCERVMYYNDI